MVAVFKKALLDEVVALLVVVVVAAVSQVSPSLATTQATETLD